MSWDRKFGVNTLIKDVYINPVSFDGTFRNPEYKYIVEIVPVFVRNGNGHEHMKIYTEGVLDVFNIGNWKISPIIILPFDWTGYSVKIEMCDANSNTYIKNGRPDSSSSPSKQNFLLEIEWVFKTIRSMENIEDCDHLELIDYISETDRKLSFYRSKNVSFNTYNEILQRLNTQQIKFRSFKDRLSKANASLLSILLNESIINFNTLTLNDSGKW